MNDKTLGCNSSHMQKKANTVEVIGESIFQPVRNGIPLICPFRPIMQIPMRNSVTGQTQLQFQAVPCQSDCPFVEMGYTEKFSETKIVIHINCTGHQRETINVLQKDAPDELLEYLRK